MKKKILYITYHYPPSNSIGSNRSFNQVTALRRLGHTVKVIHANVDHSRYIENLHHLKHSDNLSLPVNYGSLTDFYHQSFNLKNFIITKFPHKLLIFIYALKMFLVGDQRNWNTDHNFSVALGWLQEFTPDLLISTSGPIENHFFCSRFKKLYGCYWLAEYRDSWSYDPMQPGASPTSLASTLCRLKESSAIRDVDLIIAVSPLIHEYYQTYFDKKSFLMLAGWIDFEGSLPNPIHIQKCAGSKKNILHLGSMLLGKRSPIPLINLFEGNERLRQAYDLYFIGRDTRLFHNHLHNTRYAKDSVQLINEIDSTQARAEGLSADILLLLMMDHPGERHVVTGKIYEYIFLNKPIVVLDSQYSEASKIVQKYEFGYTCKSIDELEALLIKLSQDDQLISPSIANRNLFKVENAINALLRFIG